MDHVKRTEAEIRSEIRDVERFLRDVPPHSGSTGTDELRSRLERLLRELAAVRRA